ncbi:sugar ABC transporter substrate-binding protein [Streptomyces sp. NPDC051940]|uniref:ABC transporter substrate-binding protein n=1 Tax=Streptomyces sp. NPDC051940 TaxID=3155675 RepID=UPI00344272B3
MPTAPSRFTSPTRRSVLATGAAAAATLLTGCATGGTGAKDKPRDLKAGAELKGSITVWSWDVAAQALERLARAFESAHPGTKIKVLDTGYDNAYDKITVGLKANTGLADVLTVEGSQLPSYLGNFPAGFYDLTKQTAALAKDFDQAAWATVTDRRKQVLGLPWDIGPCALFHRTDYFRQAGVDPASLTTWDAYAEAGTAVKKKTGRKFLVMDSDDTGPLPLLLQQQGRGYFRDGKVAVASPEAVRALTLMKELADRELIAYEKGWDGLVSATKTGKVATTLTAAWWTGTLTSEMPELKGRFGVVPLPAFDEGGTRTSNEGGSTLCIPAQSKNPELAWAFVQFVLTDKANQVSMLKEEGLFPAYLPALDDPYLSAPQEYFGGQPALKVFADLARTIPATETTEDGAKAGEIMKSAVNKVLLRGGDPQSALRSAADQIAAATGREIAG